MTTRLTEREFLEKERSLIKNSDVFEEYSIVIYKLHKKRLVIDKEVLTSKSTYYLLLQDFITISHEVFYFKDSEFNYYCSTIYYFGKYAIGLKLSYTEKVELWKIIILKFFARQNTQKNFW